MSDLFTQLRSLLKDNGYSFTATRRTVFEVMQHDSPQTMSEIVNACRHKVDRASVYRTIALFEELNVVHRLQIGWKYKLELSDSFGYHHHHVSCTKCGKTVVTDEDPVLEQRIQALADAQGFSAETHQLEIQGVCGHCQA